MVELHPDRRPAARRLGEAVHQVHPPDRPLAHPAGRDDADDRRRQDRRRGGQRRPLGRTAGGGQVTEEIFNARIDELAGLLEPGRAIQFNSLFLDPYLWKLQLGGKRLVQKARQAGAPIDGVVVTAGIPELEEAVDLIDELNGIGISHIVFKPGTVEQIRSVIRIAAEVPTKPVIVHIEGGRAGGHHSWEDLDDLLLTTYSELRSRSNITICVGGGIGTPNGPRSTCPAGGRRPTGSR